MAKSLTGLGTTLGAQGYLEKSIATLQQARDLYKELQQPGKITEVDSLYRIAQQTLDGQELEVSAWPPPMTLEWHSGQCIQTLLADGSASIIHPLFMQRQ